MEYHVELTIPIAPQPKRRVRAAIINGRIATYQDSKTKKFERDVSLFMRPYAPKKPIKGPISLSIAFMHPRPLRLKQKTLKGAKVPADRIYKDTRPDLDNLTKAISDCCQGLFFVDDAQIAEIKTSDFYAERTGQARIEVSISSLQSSQGQGETSGNS